MLEVQVCTDDLRCQICFMMCAAHIHAGTANAIRGGLLAVALSIVVGAYLFKGDCGQATDLISSMARSLSPEIVCCCRSTSAPRCSTVPCT